MLKQMMNTSYLNAPDAKLPPLCFRQTKMILAITKGDSSFEAKDMTYDLSKEGNAFYSIVGGSQITHWHGTFTVKEDKVSGVSADVAIRN